MFLEDGKLQEEICIEKYKKYSDQAQDPQLKQLFNKLSGEEQHHHNIISQILQGQQPNLTHNQKPQQAVPQSTSQGTVNNSIYHNRVASHMCF